MVRDQGDGKVTVRLFDSDDPPQPLYYQLDKSVGTGNRHSEGALWVVFLEKAYASMKGSYASTISGQSDEALQILTGKTAGRSKISTGGGPMTETTESAFWSQGAILKYTLKYKKDKPKYLDGFKRSQAYMITQDVAQAETLMDWAVSHQNDLGKELDAAHLSDNIEAFEPIIAKINDLDLLVKGKVVTAIKGKYAGIMGTGRYTDTQEQLFTQIESALAAKKYVGASTDKVPGVVSGTGKSAGEAKVEGLVSTHAYTVLGTTTKEDGVHYIKLRNPWGSYGRQYSGKDEITGGLKIVTDPVQLQETDGTFDIELTDFTKSYDDISVGNRS